MTGQKSANQLYRESGSTLPFKDWIQREKEQYLSANGMPDDGKIAFRVNAPLTDGINKAIDTLHGESTIKTSVDASKVFGIHKYILITGSLIVVAALAFHIYKSEKK